MTDALNAVAQAIEDAKLQGLGINGQAAAAIAAYKATDPTDDDIADAAAAIDEVCPSLRTVYPDMPDDTASRILARAALSPRPDASEQEIRRLAARVLADGPPMDPTP